MTFARNFEVFSLAFYEKAQKKYRLSIAFGAADAPFPKALRKTCISHSASLFLAKADASIFHACQLFLDKQLRAIVVDANNSIRCRIVGNDLPCNQRLQLLLDQPFQRTCTIVDIVSLVDDIFLGCL